MKKDPNREPEGWYLKTHHGLIMMICAPLGMWLAYRDAAKHEEERIARWKAKMDGAGDE